MEVRPALPEEYDALRPVVVGAFGEEGTAIGRLLDDLVENEAFRAAFVAVDQDTVVGYVSLTRGWLDADRELVEAWVLSPLAVAPDHQRRGIGAALVAEAERWTRAAGVPLLFLEGDPGYYARLGWAPAHEHGLVRPSERIPEPACQVRLLDAYVPWMRGRLVYPDVFWRHDAVGLRGDHLARVQDALANP